MKYWGFEKVYVLNGGWPYWKARDLPTESGAQTTSTGSFEPQRDPAWLVRTEDVVAREESCLLLDGRGEASFQKARIPGSVSLPFSTLMQAESGLFKSKEEMQAVFDAAGDWKDRPVVSTCGAGYTASVVLFCLHELERLVPLYDGSLAVWKEEGHPVEQG